MDHLLLPRSPTHPRIEVPLLKSKPYKEPFDSFPERHGWSKSEIVSPELGPDRREQARAFLQEWPFFGPAEEVFGPLTKRAHWIRQGRDGKDVLSTTYLRNLTQQLHRRQKDPSVNASRTTSEATVLKALDVAMDMVNLLVLRKSPLAETNGALAIAALCDIIYKSFAAKLDAYRASGKLDLGVSQPIQAQMLRDGWCQKDIHRLSHQLDLASLYLASNLSVPESRVRHTGCTKVECVKSRVENKDYVTEHDRKKCDGHCAFVGVRQSELAQILLSGSVPLISFSSKIESGPITLVPVGPGTPYVAISHVWSHGLGNPHDNALPRCQLQRISKLVASLGVGSQRDPPLFWLDTICFPVHHEEAADRALIYMRRSYADATAVLVLDRYLESTYSEPLLRTECLVRIIVSSWTRRLWTLQEGALAKALFFNFADNVVEMEEAVFLHTAELTMITSDGSLEYQPIDSTISGLWNYWKISVSEQPRQLLSSFSNGLRWRGTSIAMDEPLCLATLANLNMEKLLKTPEEDRMGTFWSLLPGLSLQAIFWSGPRLEQAGYRWAPSTFPNQPDAIFQDFATKSFLEFNEISSATCTDRGLRFSCPGIFLNTWRANIGRHVWIRDQSRRWYILYRPNTDPICLRKRANDKDMQSLALIMKLPLSQAFQGPFSQRSITCVITSITDVNEENDILYAHTEGVGYLMPAESPCISGEVREIVKHVEVQMGVSNFGDSDPGLETPVPVSSSKEKHGTEAIFLGRKEDDSDADSTFFKSIELSKVKTDRVRARDEGDRLSLDLGKVHLMFDGIELEEDQSWCLD